MRFLKICAHIDSGSLRWGRRLLGMSRSLFWLSDEAWAAIEPHLLGFLTLDHNWNSLAQNGPENGQQVTLSGTRSKPI